MRKNKNGANGRFKLTDKRITAALNQAARDVVEIHRQAGQPLVVWKNGKTVLISADEIELTKPVKKNISAESDPNLKDFLVCVSASPSDDREA